MLDPHAVMAYTNPQPGNLVLILTDGEVFAAQEFPEELADDTPALEGFAKIFVLKLYDKLLDTRRERDGSASRSQDEATDRPSAKGEPGGD
jgi:hypothetical protein